MTSLHFVSHALTAEQHLERIHNLESRSYPEDEAASYNNLKYRLQNANELFVGLFKDDPAQISNLIGFCCATRSKGNKLTHSTMFNHDPEGELVCIHSVVIDPELRRKKYGDFMMKKYVEHLRTLKNINSVRLLCKDNLIQFYKNAGFEFIGKSDVVHGKETWYEMKIDFQ